MAPNPAKSDNIDSFRVKLIRKLKIELKKFNLEELKSIVLPAIGFQSWSDIKHVLVKSKLKLNNPNIASAIESLLKKNNFSNDAIRDLIIRLELVQISRHSTKREWHTFEMKSRTESYEEIADMQDLQSAINNKLKKHNIKAKCLVECYSNMFFVLLIMPPTAKQKNSIQVPSVFAMKMNDNHFFCTKKIVNDGFKTVLTETLGYKTHKSVKLHGKDLETLSRLLRNKKTGVVPNQVENMPINAEPIIKEKGIDFTQSAHRKKYLKKTMGCESYNLNSVTFEFSDMPVELPPSLESSGIDLSDLKLDFSLQLKGQNIFDLLPSMAENLQLAHPTPEYVVDFMSKGKNEIHYRNAE